MDQFNSRGRFSLAFREPPRNLSYHGSTSASPMHDEAEERQLESSPSSSEATPIMTPDTSDDEDEDQPHVSEGDSENSDAADLLLGIQSSERLLQESHNTASGAIIGNLSSIDGESCINDPNESLLSDVDSYRSSSTYSRGRGSFGDEGEEFHDALLGSEIYYGVLISTIRREDREALDKISFSPGEARSRIRVYRELRSLHEDGTVPYMSVAPIDGNLSNCLACFEGAPDTPYEGGIFWLHIDYPHDYPVKAPTITFLTPVYHPNIDSTGRICISILEEAWSPCLQTQSVLLSVLSVLHSPIVEPQDEILVPEIGKKYLNDKDDYCQIARVYTANAHGSRPDTSNLVNLTPVQ